MKEFIIGKNDAGRRLDRFLRAAAPAVPSGLIQKAIRTKNVKINGGRAPADRRLEEGDRVALYLADHFFEQAEEASFYRIAEPRVSVVYEDARILLVDKPQGMLCHAGESGGDVTLIDHIQAYLYQKGDYRPDAENAFAPALCNRIDRNTSGLVIAAKTLDAMRLLNDKIKAREVEKTYLCLVHGRPEPPEGELRHFLRRDMARKQVSVHRGPIPGGRTAVTLYRTLRRAGELSLVECTLVTGRTHQIRAQMAAAGWPLYGDGKYGALRPGEPRKQALCAYSIRFAFKDGGCLEDLNGRTFRLHREPFARELELFGE
ncbi:RluA family pseudouridine synthase [Oscillospiraceae bacterium OttesenSCG-928-F05]|nr:RluA family pseudouridine synthase [Oscillospiraceae bacterium OttesenSCG-928-F05]